MTPQTIKIDGMSCTHCIRAVQQAIEGVSGVTVVDVAIGSATVLVDTDTQRSALDAALVAAGYRPHANDPAA